MLGNDFEWGIPFIRNKASPKRKPFQLIKLLLADFWVLLFEVSFPPLVLAEVALS